MIFRGGMQRFLDRFEPSGAAFIYRSAISSPGVIVTAEERAVLVKQYEDRHVLFVLYLFADLPVTIGVTVLAYAIDPSHEAYPVVAWLTLFFSPAIVAIWSVSGPNKLIKGRPLIDSGPAPEVIKMQKIERSSWGSLTWNIVFAALWEFGVIVDGRTPLLLRVVFVLAATGALIFAIKELVEKIRYKRPHDP